MTTTASEPRTQAPPHWSLDRDGSSVGFTVKTMWGLIPVRGRFDRFAGSYEVGRNGTTIELTIDADSVDTGNGKRDEHLRSSDFFDVDDHALVRFRSTRVSRVRMSTLPTPTARRSAKATRKRSCAAGWRYCRARRTCTMRWDCCWCEKATRPPPSRSSATAIGIT